MYEKNKDQNFFKNIVILFIVACSVALLMGLLCRSLVVHAKESEDATLTDAKQKLSEIQQFREDLNVGTSTDANVDKSPYLTNNTSPLPLQTNDLLLSIRNVLVCLWFTVVFIWFYEKMKAIIFRLGGVKKQ